MTNTAQSRTGYTEVNGARLYYEVAGNGPAVAFLHAGIADSGMWDDQMADFAERYTVIRYDHRGFGRSSMPDEPFSLSDDLHGLLRHLGIKKATLVGCSLGGATAIRFTLEHPAMVAALVPVGSGLGGFEASAEATAQWAEIKPLYDAKEYERAAELVVRMWVDGPRRTPDRVPTTVRDRVWAMERQNMELPEPEHAAPIPLDPPEIARLGEIRAPTLILVGDEDVADIQRIADILADGIAGARKVVQHDTAHVPNMEQPEEFNGLVLDFLAQHVG